MDGFSLPKSAHIRKRFETSRNKAKRMV